MKLVTDVSLTSRPAAVAVGWTPAALFAAGEPGAWFDPSAPGALFQDAAATIPVTGPDQPVGCMLDLSGRGCHATQDDPAARPMYRRFGDIHSLEFDGLDDMLSTPGIDLTQTPQLGAFAGVRKPADIFGPYVGQGDWTAGDLGAWDLAVGASFPGSTPVLRDTYRGGYRQMSDFNTVVGRPFSGQRDDVHGVYFDMSATGQVAKIGLRINGAPPPTVALAGDDATGPGFRNDPVVIGARNGSFATICLHGLVIRGASFTPSEIAQTEAYLALRSGVTLSL
ncbi:hypothetical protein roselon_01367 [Roseibacterium elongatum DSM 19469]|uniref:Uncharacterized protein n=1 Tax=Roseicyclus elongatus DSM 19469 TaxID=1294273 RepID=W8SMI2_9RHOB|nr:hypothetical protein [Roseibacterium elongatum]AHM03755.1 hypothetical protein roselon_01367 [Roseibacterium elongatum DSM 19469]